MAQPIHMIAFEMFGQVSERRGFACFNSVFDEFPKKRITGVLAPGPVQLQDQRANEGRICPDVSTQSFQGEESRPEMEDIQGRLQVLDVACSVIISSQSFQSHTREDLIVSQNVRDQSLGRSFQQAHPLGEALLRAHVGGVSCAFEEVF
jgi:hypothetical protein